MSTHDFPRQQGKLSPALLASLAVLVAALAGGGWWLMPRLEREAPQVQLTPDGNTLGRGTLEISLSDTGMGLKSVSATLSTGGNDIALAAEQFAQPVPAHKISIDLAAKLAGIKEGPATLRISVRDASLWQFFKGNETVLQKEMVLDLTPPAVELIADDRYVNFGGVGVLVYKASEPVSRSGVRIGDYFFPGYPGVIASHPEHFLVFFAHAYNVPAEARPVLVVTDKAGNTKEMPVSYELKNVKYKKSTIALSDNFLQKITPLLTDPAARQGSPREVFNRINKDMRKLNEAQILKVTSQGSPAILWKGAFTQLSNSKVEANFADERTYTYEKEAVSDAFHLGFDLSVTKNYPVEAANSGKVAFTGDLGIYGNVVILDHGLGLFTLYGHLSSIDVKVGDSVEQKQILGKTGETGLAAGDHLHYGVYLNGVAVLPVEWWDRKWITDNIEPKLAGKTGEAIAEEQQPRKSRKADRAQPAQRKAAGKRKR